MNKLILYSFIMLFASHLIYAEDEFLSYKSNTYRWLQERKKFDEKMVSKLSDFRPKTQTFVVSKKDIFKIHYDTLGNNAVDLTDKNKNGVPDYIDSVAFYADYIYNVMINEMGYKTPFPEEFGGGSPHYDIYILDIGNGLRGEAYYGETRAEYELFPRKIFPRYTSYIIIDNNYSPNDRTINDDGTNKSYPTYHTHGILGMKITLAHEFHHAIQFIYGDPNSNMYSIHEMVSVFMENRLFHESTDYLQYVRALFKDFTKYPFGDGNANIGYSYGIYFHFINQFFGETTIKRLWELIENGLFEFQALDSALKEKNSSIKKSWLEFISWIYHTGNRTIDGYSFYQARLFPDFKFVYTNEISADNNIQLKSQVLPFEIRPIRIILKTNSLFNTPDTLDFILSNTEINRVFQQFITLSDIDLYYPSNSPKAKALCNGYYFVNSNADFQDTAFCRKGYKTIAINDAYPSPFNKNIQTKIYLPTPKEIPFNTNVSVQIFNTEMEQIFSTETTVMVHNSNRVVVLELDSDKFSSGIYFYKIKSNDYLKIGKFVVK